MTKKGLITLIEDAIEMELTSAKDAGALGFYARLLVQATLPHLAELGLVPTGGR